MDSMAIVLAVNLAHTEATSALPNAPVVVDRRRERVVVLKMRDFTARTLRRAADRVEPTPALTYG